MPKLTITSKPRSTTIDCDGEDLHVTFDAAALTPKAIEEMAAGEIPETTALVNFLAGTLVKWDLEEDDGSMVAITIERLMDLPVQFLFSVLTGMQERLAPSGEA